MPELTDGTKQRTVIFLPPGLKLRVKALAAETESSFGEVVRQALAEWVAPPPKDPALRDGPECSGCGDTGVELSQSSPMAPTLCARCDPESPLVRAVLDEPAPPLSICGNCDWWERRPGWYICSNKKSPRYLRVRSETLTCDEFEPKR